MLNYNAKEFRYVYTCTGRGEGGVEERKQKKISTFLLLSCVQVSWEAVSAGSPDVSFIFLATAIYVAYYVATLQRHSLAM